MEEAVGIRQLHQAAAVVGVSSHEETVENVAAAVAKAVDVLTVGDVHD